MVLLAQKTQMRSRRPRRSYAERVVTAVSDIRRRTRRDSIHIKTLATQVKKNAEAQQDKLGPYWKSWVKLACEDLKSRTLLDSVSPPGHVALSSEGKRRIAKTLQSYSIPDNHEHSVNCKENAGWTKLIRELPNLDVKHARRSSIRLQSMNDVDVGHSRKKALSRMTKTELLVEVEELRSALEQLSCERDTLESEKSQEVKRLNERLEAQDDELLEMRDKLFFQKDVENDLGDTTMVDDDMTIALDELHSPPFLGSNDKFDNNVQLTGDKDDSRTLLKPHIDLSLMRTQSGSFISSISKQPTPAPSDYGSEPSSPMPINDYLGVELGPFDPDSTYVDSRDVAAAGSQGTLGLDKSREGLQVYTPLSTPPPPLKKTGDGSWGAIDLERRRRIEELVEERDDAKRELQRKSASLRERDYEVLSLNAQAIRQSSENKKFDETLASLLKSEESYRMLLGQHEVTITECKTLKDNNVHLLECNDRLERQLSDQANELLITNEHLQENKRELTEVQAIAEEALTRLNEARLESEKTKAFSASLARQVRSVEEALQESNIDRETLRVKLREAVDETCSVKSEIRDVIGLLEKETADMQERESALRQRVEQTEAEAANLRESIRISNDQSARLHLETEAALARLEQEQEERLRLELEILNAQMAHTAYRKDAENNVLALQEEINKAEKGIELVRESERTLNEILRSSMEQVVALSARLETADARTSNLQELIDAKEAELFLSRKDLEMAHQRDFTLQASVATLQAQLNGVEVDKGRLHEMLKVAEERAENLEGYCRDMIKRQREQCEDMERHMNKKRKRTPFDLQSYTSAVSPVTGPAHAVDNDNGMVMAL